MIFLCGSGANFTFTLYCGTSTGILAKSEDFGLVVTPVCFPQIRLPSDARGMTWDNYYYYHYYYYYYYYYYDWQEGETGGCLAQNSPRHD